MESDSLYIFPFSAIKFDSKPQYLINIGILNIDTDFFWLNLFSFFKLLFFLFFVQPKIFMLLVGVKKTAIV